MREFFTIAIFKIKADIRMNKTTLNSQKEKHSMLSLRRATFRRQRARRGPQHFYPRSPCGERRLVGVGGMNNHVISIHALLAESDSSRIISSSITTYFYPRSPCGERLRAWTLNINGPIFLSTLSLRRATAKVHKTVGHFCAYETNFMEIASSC